MSETKPDRMFLHMQEVTAKTRARRQAIFDEAQAGENPITYEEFVILRKRRPEVWGGLLWTPGRSV